MKTAVQRLRQRGERACFIADLLGLLERDAAPARMILAIRADYLGPCATYPELASRIGEGTVLVGPVNDDEVRRAVEGPARYAGLDVEQDLLDPVVADVRGRPGAGRGAGGGRPVEGRVPGRVTGRVSRLPA